MDFLDGNWIETNDRVPSKGMIDDKWKMHHNGLDTINKIYSMEEIPYNTNSGVGEQEITIDKIYTVIKNSHDQFPVIMPPTCNTRLQHNVQPHIPPIQSATLTETYIIILQ